MGIWTPAAVILAVIALIASDSVEDLVNKGNFSGVVHNNSIPNSNHTRFNPNDTVVEYVDWFSVPIPDVHQHVRNVDEFIFSASRQCGVSPKVGPSHWSNISPGQFPWVAAILTSDDVFYCSGSLISESIVLTTASCILNYKKTNLALKIVLGGYGFPADLSAGRPQLELFSKAAVLHPEFNETSTEVKHNIGLIRLEENINFDLYPHIFPICIVGPSLINPKALSDKCKVQGWPDLKNVDVKRARSYLTGGDVQINTSGCKPDNACITGTACIANEGSAVACPGSTLRSYQWGIVASQPSCPRGTSTSLSTVSIFDNYDFILKFLLAPNSNSATNDIPE